MDNTHSPSPDSYVFFWKPREEYGEFSQWLHSPFTFDGMTFANCEQFMMFGKAVIFNDNNIAKTILKGFKNPPSEHKKMGRRVKNFNEGVWNNMSMNVVVIANLCKFTQDIKLRDMLMETGDKMLVEASSMDRIWGIGFTKQNALYVMGDWGQNKLGRALMIVRKIIGQMVAQNINMPFKDTTQLLEMCANMDTDEFDPEAILPSFLVHLDQFGS